MRYRDLTEEVWHGSGRRFDAFSLDHFGSGEGAAVYGYGLYFASSREVADHYRNKLSGSEHFYYRGRVIVELSINEAVVEIWQKRDPHDAARGYIVSMARTKKARRITEAHRAFALRRAIEVADHQRGIDAMVISRVPNHQPRAPMYDDIIEATRTCDITGIRLQKPGATYQVELPDRGYLLWDLPFDQQPDEIKAAVGRLTHREWPGMVGSTIGRLVDDFSTRNLSGESFYSELSGILRSKQSASEALARVGLTGIKYLDGNSRAIGSGTYNFVVFDPNVIRIKAVL